MNQYNEFTRAGLLTPLPEMCAKFGKLVCKANLPANYNGIIPQFLIISDPMTRPETRVKNAELVNSFKTLMQKKENEITSVNA